MLEELLRIIDDSIVTTPSSQEAKSLDMDIGENGRVLVVDNSVFKVSNIDAIQDFIRSNMIPTTRRQKLFFKILAKGS